jgi:general secretion pathway protein H
MSPPRGFTLVELLVVLAIAAGAAALVGSGWRAAAERSGALAVLAELRTARARAIAERRETAWLPRALPGGIAVAAEPAPVRFFADGGSSGAEITLGAGPRREVIEVDWLTGRAALRREAP